jgi:hypothetical protein
VRDPVWISGLGLQFLGFGIYLVAVAFAPISLVAVVMQGGIALFVAMSVVFLGERASIREWAGIGAIGIAMLMLSLSLGAGTPESRLDLRALAALSAAGAVATIVPLLAARGRNYGAAAAVAAGILFGFGGIFTKAMTETFFTAADGPLAVRIALNPFVYLMMGVNLSGIVLQQNAFHSVRAIIVMPTASALSNLIPIIGGIIAFGEHLPADPAFAAMRLGSFALTIVAGFLLATAAEGVPAPAERLDGRADVRSAAGVTESRPDIS